jgi:hypothetical protein
VETTRIDGEIADVENGGSRLSVETEDETLCVNVPADARVLEVTNAEDAGGVEEIDRSALAEGDTVSVFGEEGHTCFSADTVIVFKPDTE